MNHPDSDAVKWIPGRDISAWPELKYARGLQHLGALKARMDVWAAGSRVERRQVISEDRRTVEVFADVPNEFPLNELALELGDAIHCLRAALDAVVWELSRLDGTVPRDPTGVKFPVCKTEQQWEQALKSSLVNVPPTGQERIRLLQPFTAEHELSSLELLHRADIRDKHRSQLSCSFVLSQVELDGCSFKFEDEGDIPDPPFEPLDILEGPVTDGARLIAFRSSARIESATTPLGFGLQAMIQTDTGDHEFNQMIDAVVGQTRMALDIIYVGVDEAMRQGRLVRHHGQTDPSAG